MKRSFHYLLFLVFLFSFLLKFNGFLIPVNAKDQKIFLPSPPSHLTALDEKDGSVPLYWFKPEILPETVFYDDGILKTGMYANVEWFDNAFGLKFTPPSSPYILLKSEVFICYQGSSGDANYDFSQPFSISVNEDSGGIPGAFICVPVDAFATGRDTLAAWGEWVEIEHDLLFLDSSDFWIVFHWKDGFPLSPLVGVDSSPNCGRSFAGWTKYGFWEWSPLSYNIMIRAQILCNGETPLSLKRTSQPDSFSIYRSKNPDDLTYPINYLSSLDSFEYDDKSVENDQTYYYKVTAWYGAEESEPSIEVMATPKSGAELWASRDSLDLNLGFDENKLENLVLKNIGGLPLDFSVKLDIDIDSSYGGKDYFGYLWTNGDKVKEISFLWINSSSETIVSNPGDDNQTYGPFSLGFGFPFYGNYYDSLFINSNGWVSFVQPLLKLDYINKPLPSTTGPFNLLALFWDDLEVTDSSEVSYYTGQDTFIVNFKKLKHWFFGGAYTFQGILTKDGKMVFNYLSMKDITSSATVGIQNENSSFALPLVFDQDYIHDSLTIEIIPGWIEAEPRTGTILPDDSLMLDLIIDSRFLSEGSFCSYLIIEAEDKNHNLDPFIIPIALKIDTLTWAEEDFSVQPISFYLSQNYPNPFNPCTAILFSVHGSRKTVNSPIPTSLKIYNIKGQLVKTLVDELKEPGRYVITWNGKNEKGDHVSSGVYFYQLKVGERKVNKKMIKLK